MTSVLAYSTSTPVDTAPNVHRDECEYNACCLNGHVFAVLPGTELEGLCKQRPDTQIGALTLADEDCPYCIEDRREQQRRNAEMYSLFGCALYGPECTGKSKDGSDCACVLDQQPIPNGKYDDQIRGYAPWE